MPGSARKKKPKTYTVLDFAQEFPTDDACLEWLWRHLHSADGSHAFCPKCQKERRFHRVKSRHSYSCDSCGQHVHPTAGTIFEKSTTPLRLWFHAVFLLSQTRCGISAKQLQRELGVTYKTAWRMHNKIRQLLGYDDDSTPLQGAVEVEESAWGGKIRAGGRSRPATPTQRRQDAMERIKARPTIFAMVERGGRARVVVLPTRSKAAIRKALRENVSPDAVLYDEWALYNELGTEFAEHHQIKHRDDVYALGHVHTQTVEGFFGNVKRGLSGVQHNVSRKWLQTYVDEFAFKYSHRDDGVPMFKLFLANVRKPATS